MNVAERAVPSTKVLAMSAARLGAGAASMRVGAKTREAQERTSQSVSKVYFLFSLITCTIAYVFLRPGGIASFFGWIVHKYDFGGIAR